MTEAEKGYLQEWRNNWIDDKVKGLSLKEQTKFIKSNYELELMQSYADEQVKKALEEQIEFIVMNEEAASNNVCSHLTLTDVLNNIQEVINRLKKE